MIKKIFSKRSIPYWIIAILLIVILGQYGESRSQHYQERLQYYYVPHVELSNIQFNSDVNGEYLVYATGFVKFKSISDQPKGMWQYQKIEPSFERDERGEMKYILTDIIKMHYIPPREFDPVELTKVEENGAVLTLSDEGGNIFRVNKNTKEISTFDNTGDSASLITNESDFEDYMRIIYPYN